MVCPGLFEAIFYVTHLQLIGTRPCHLHRDVPVMTAQMQFIDVNKEPDWFYHRTLVYSWGYVDQSGFLAIKNHPSDRFPRVARIQDRAVPLILHWWSFQRSLEWFTLSQAFENSSGIRSVCLHALAFLATSSTNMVSCVLHDLFCNLSLGSDRTIGVGLLGLIICPAYM